MRRLCLAVILASLLFAQNPLAEIRGTLRIISKKEIVIDEGDEKIVTFRRIKKTKFWKGSKEIRESEFHPGDAVVVEANRTLIGEFEAVNVFLGEPPASRR